MLSSKIETIHNESPDPTIPNVKSLLIGNRSASFPAIDAKSIGKSEPTAIIVPNVMGLACKYSAYREANKIFPFKAIWNINVKKIMKYTYILHTSVHQFC